MNTGTAIVNLVAVTCLVFVTSCAIPDGWKYGQKANINNKTKFSSKKYGVKSSPRITTAKKVRKGGGRYQIGKPYKINGKWYYPKDQPGYNKTGMASWYGPNFHGRLTANGEIYDQNSLSAAHPTLPLPSYARVTNLENGSSVIVRINDRGPFSKKRIIDLSARASELLDYQKKGLTKVRVRYLGRARMDGRDNKYLMASYNPAKGSKKGWGIWPKLPTFAPGASRPGTMIASVASPKAGNIIPQGYSQPVQSAFINPRSSALVAGAFEYVPIPAMRPTPIYEGLPMDLYRDYRIASYRLQPLGFSEGARYNWRIEQAFSVIDKAFAKPFVN